MSAITRPCKVGIGTAVVVALGAGLLLHLRGNRAEAILLDIIHRRDWHGLFAVELGEERQQNTWTADQFGCLLGAVAQGNEDQVSKIKVSSTEEVSQGIIKIDLSAGDGQARWIAFAHRGQSGFQFEVATLPLFLNKLGVDSEERLSRLATAMEGCGVKRIVGRAGTNELTPASLREVASGQASAGTLWRPVRRERSLAE